jgi:reactive intermediate/imine deaminase
MTKTILSMLLALPLAGAELKVIAPAGATVVGPYSPGVLTDDFLYVSGQGARNAEGKFAADTRQQILDSLENVRGIVEAAGLTMEHVVYTQVYLSDMSGFAGMEDAWRKVFPRNPPARAVLGVFRMPTNTPVEVTAIAVRDLGMKKGVNPPGHRGYVPAAVSAGPRVFLSASYGSADSGLDGMKAALAAAGLDFAHLAFVNVYVGGASTVEQMNAAYAKRFEFGNTPARATIRVNDLPEGAAVGFTGVAVRDLKQRRTVRPKNMEPSATASPCVWAGDALYCSAKAGFIPGPNGGIYASTVEHQARQSLRNLLDGLEEAGLKFDRVVATNVYVDDLEEFAKMNAVYAEYFPSLKPTRTTVQPLRPVERKPDARGRYPKLVEISLVAVR